MRFNWSQTSKREMKQQRTFILKCDIVSFWKESNIVQEAFISSHNHNTNTKCILQLYEYSCRPHSSPTEVNGKFLIIFMGYLDQSTIYIYMRMWLQWKQFPFLPSRMYLFVWMTWGIHSWSCNLHVTIIYQRLFLIANVSKYWWKLEIFLSDCPCFALKCP